EDTAVERTGQHLAGIAHPVAAEGKAAIVGTAERRLERLAQAVTAKAAAILRAGHDLARLADSVAAKWWTTAIDRTRELGLDGGLADSVAADRLRAAVVRTIERILARLAQPVAAERRLAIERAREGALTWLTDSVAARRQAERWRRRPAR